MKKIMWAVSLLSLIGTAAAVSFLPERVPMHYDMAGSIDRWGSRYETLIFPVMMLLLSLFWTLLIRYFERKAQKTAEEKERAGAQSNAKVLGIAGVSVAAMFTVMQAFMLYGAYNGAVPGAAKQTVDIGKISVILMGIVLIALGNVMTKTRMNHIVGVRIRWSMFNDATWRKSNRFGAYALMLAGVLTILMAVLMKSASGAMLAMLGLVIAAAAATAVYAHKVYVQEIEAGKGEP